MLRSFLSITRKFTSSSAGPNPSDNIANLFVRRINTLKKWTIRLLILSPILSVGYLYISLDKYKKLDFYTELAHLLNPEDAHNMAIKMLSLPPIIRYMLNLINEDINDPLLETKVFGHVFDSPLGLAAGFDKNARAINGCLDLGFSFVEIGSVTPLPQDGNPKPRVFRLKDDIAVINRYGFNSDGLLQVAYNLRDRNNDISRGFLGINLGKNKTGDAINDYVAGVQALGIYADYLVVNVSSPNTPGLRALQSKEALVALLTAVKDARDKLVMKNGKRVIYSAGESKIEEFSRPLPPLLLKIAPDLNDEDKKDIAQVCLKLKIDGLIISNTTITRPESIVDSQVNETGGLSGKPLFEMSTKVLSDMYKLTNGKVTIIGAGGITSGEDAYAKIRAGASLLQVYSAFSIKGPSLIPKINNELAALLKRDKLKLHEAVGIDHRLKKI